MEKYNASRKDILALLKEAGGVSEQSVRDISQRTGIPEADIWGTGHFYELLSHPDIETRVCQGLTCQLAGASELEGQPVSCLGQCDRAPVAIGRDLHLSHFGRERGGVTPDNPELPMNLAGADSSDYAALHRARSMHCDGVSLDDSSPRSRLLDGVCRLVPWNLAHLPEKETVFISQPPGVG